MKTNIIVIGNSRGIRIPRAILKLCHIRKEVDLEVKREAIIIKPVNRIPRESWEESFKTMHRNKDDQLLINDNLDLNMENWEW